MGSEELDKFIKTNFSENNDCIEPQHSHFFNTRETGEAYCIILEAIADLFGKEIDKIFRKEYPEDVMDCITYGLGFKGILKVQLLQQEIKNLKSCMSKNPKYADFLKAELKEDRQWVASR